jgi:hypothetical protein
MRQSFRYGILLLFLFSCNKEKKFPRQGNLIGSWENYKSFLDEEGELNEEILTLTFQQDWTATATVKFTDNGVTTLEVTNKMVYNLKRSNKWISFTSSGTDEFCCVSENNLIQWNKVNDELIIDPFFSALSAPSTGATALKFSRL